MDNFREPIFDDLQLEQIEEQQNEQLINELVGCIIDLGNTVAMLRVEVNCLTLQLNPNAPPAYYEPYSDLCQSFEDHPAYTRFAEQLSRLIYE